MRRRWLTIAVILTVPSGCDNVTWGGADVRLERPSTHEAAPAAAVDETGDSTPPPARVTQPFLLAGTRSGDSATLVVVGLVEGDSLGALPTDASAPGFLEQFITTRLSTGTDFVLFSDGARVGHLAATRAGVDSSYCVPRPTVSGTVELVPGASGARHFLALPAAWAETRPYTPYHSFHHSYDQRVASLRLAAAAIPGLHATWPTSLLDSRADIQAFQIAGTDAFAATFLFEDRLTVSEPKSEAYSLFIIGTREADAYRASYVDYRPVAEKSKGSPRYFDHLDWNSDGNPEILLDVFGARNRWFAGLSRTAGGWVQTFQDRCGISATGH